MGRVGVVPELPFTAVGGVEVGHATDLEAGTGCTVFLFDPPARIGLDIRGSAAGTRAVEPARAFHVVDRAPAVLLAGGSSFGLGATGGVMRWLEEREVGFDVGVARVPVVPTAILFDLSFGSASRRPDEAMAYAACEAATAEAPAEGSVGVGTGATVGKIRGAARAMKGGFGAVALEGPGGLVVGAAAAVNAIGDVRRLPGGEIVAGALDEDGNFLDTWQTLAADGTRPTFEGPDNTTLAVIATNARLDREALIKVSQTVHDGLARVIWPCHTTVDGDLAFSLATGQVAAALDVVCVLAQQATARAVLRAVEKADGLGRLPAARDVGGSR